MDSPRSTIGLRLASLARPRWRLAGLLLLSAIAVVPLALGTAPGESYQSYALKHQRAADVQRMLAEVLPPGDRSVHVVVDAQTNQLLVRGPEKVQQVAAELIRKVDRPPARPARAESVVQAYACPPDQLARVAQRLRGASADDKNVRVTVDAATNQLLVLAPPETQPAIERQVTAALAVPPSPPEVDRPEITPQIVSLAHRPVDTVPRGLRELLAARVVPSTGEVGGWVIEGKRGKRVELRLDAAHQRVTIRGDAALSDQIVRLLRAMDASTSAPDRAVRVVPLERANLGQVQRALKAYQGEPWEDPRPPDASSNRPGERGSRRRPGEREVTPAAYFQQQPEPVRTPTDEPAIPLNRRPLADDEAEQRAQRLRELGIDLEVETLPDLDVVILRGNRRDVDDVLKIIREIERLSGETQPAIDVYFLRHAASEPLAALVKQVDPELTIGRQGRVSVTALVKPNALLLIGWGEAVKAVKELIGKLDQPVPPQTQFRVFRLRHAPAAAASTTVQEFFAKRAGLGTKVHITPDVRSNSLIAQASPRDMAEVAALVERLDTPDSEAVNQVRMFRLKNTLAADLASTLQAAIDSSRAGQSGAAAAGQKSSVLELLTIDAQGEKVLKSGLLSDVKITADARANTVLVTAPSESMELVAALILQLDESPTAVAQIKVFRIINGDAADLVQMLRSLLPAQSGTAAAVPLRLAAAEAEASLAPLRFSVDARTNSIIAAGSSGDLSIVEALLLRLDEKDVKQRQNVVYRLKNAPALDVAQAINDFLRSERQVQQAVLGTQNPFQQIESEVVVVPEPVSNSLVISATPRFFEDIKELVEQLDSQPPQVMIQVLIGEVLLSNVDEFGVELGIQDSLLFDRSLLGNLVTTTTSTTFGNPPTTVQNQNVVAASNTPGFNFNNQSLGNSGSDQALANSNRVGGQALSNFAVGRVNNELGYGGMVLSASSESVSVLLRALQESRRMEVLARPQVMTLDNQPAYIQVGQRVPRVIGTTINQIGQVNNISLENVGLILGVTPRISPEGKVVMEVDAEKSEMGSEAEGIPVSISATGQVIRSPRINIATAQTTVSAADGETIVLGGLITKNRQSIDRRVPLLSQIPVLGELFKYSSQSVRRTELLIILTPHVVRSAEDLERIKLAEAAKLSWCAADVHEIHGPTGMCRQPDCPICNADIPIIYPDENPRGIELREALPELVPSGPEDVPAPTAASRRPVRSAWRPPRPATPLEPVEARPAPLPATSTPPAVVPAWYQDSPLPLVR